MINFGIDLGTTNSLVAKFNKGTVEIFKDPRHQGIEVLPSIVGFRNDRILIGQQAKTYTEKDPKNCVGRFKRKMGTTESFNIKAISQSKTPIELSAFILKELKTFIHTGEIPEAVVITIPASFDMVQSNATKEAGFAAGFKQVVLLQEPIAASLAYANKEKSVDLKNSQWIVYDLGGGTFDVALVKIMGGELKIVDHEGDNYLGGTDFDVLIVEKIIVPQLEKRGKFTNLLAQMKSETGQYNKLWYYLLARAEEAKIELSTHSSAEIDLSRNLEDENGKVINDYIAITQSEFETIIKDTVDNTAEKLKKILTRNSLRPQELKFVLMVGGSTYIPFVRNRIEELLGIPVNTGIDPTNAIVIGAAYFAATKKINFGEKATEKSVQPDALRIKVSYNSASQDREEMFSAKIEGDIAGLYYRIIREDGGYDSGLKKLSSRITDDLPLQEDTYNLFSFHIYDSRNNPVSADFGSIQIAQGKYSVAGQMLPHDLSLVLDDFANEDTRLELIFSRNSVLPTRRKMTKEASKTLIHGTDDEIRIIVVEGPTENHFTANKIVGHLVIPAKQLRRDIIRGTDIDLEFEVSESRDLRVKAYVTSINQEYNDVFTPKFREVPVRTLQGEIELLEIRLEQEKNEAISNENFEVAQKLENMRSSFQEIRGAALMLDFEDVTDDRYKLEDRKRNIAQELNLLTCGKRIERLRTDYLTAKDEVTNIVNESGNDHERRQLHEIVTQEHTFLPSMNPQKLESAIDHLHYIGFQILRRTPEFLLNWFHQLVGKRETFNDQIQAKNLIDAGKKHIEVDDYDKLAEVNMRLHDLLPQQEQNSKEMRYFTGIT